MEIYRCLKIDEVSTSVGNLIRLSVDKYNNTIHSVIGITPFEALYGKTLTPNNTISNSQQRKMQNELILAKLKNKRIKDRMFQNKNRGTPKVYEPGEEVLLKKTSRSSQSM